MEIEKLEKLRSLFSQIDDLCEIKKEMVELQNYQEAADARDTEKKLIREIDEIIGVKGYYNDLLKMEEINFHLDQIKNSMQTLKRLDYKMGSPLGIEIDSEALLELQRQQIEIQQQILNFRVNVGLPEKKFNKRLAF